MEEAYSPTWITLSIGNHLSKSNHGMYDELSAQSVVKQLRPLFLLSYINLSALFRIVWIESPLFARVPPKDILTLINVSLNVI